MPNGDWGSVVRHLRNVLTNVVIERELAVALEEHDRRGGELLRDRGDVKDRSRANRRVGLEVGHSVAALEGDAAVATDANRAPRPIGAAEALENTIHAASK